MGLLISKLIHLNAHRTVAGFDPVVWQVYIGHFLVISPTCENMSMQSHCPLCIAIYSRSQDASIDRRKLSLSHWPLAKIHKTKTDRRVRVSPTCSILNNRSHGQASAQAQVKLSYFFKTWATARLKVHKHELFFLLFLQKPNPYGPKGV